MFLILMIPYEIPVSVRVYSIYTVLYTFTVFYLGFLLVSRLLLRKGNRLRKGLLLIPLIAGIYGIKLSGGLLIDGIFDQELRNFAHFKWWVISGDFVNQTVILFIGVLARIGEQYFIDQRKQAEIRIENQNQELAFLKAQINPHFFFNTLNNIYSLVYKKSDEAPASLLKLSDIMRYMLYDSKSDLVPLDLELLHLNNYLELERLRFREPGFADFQLEGETGGWQVPPMLLLSFVENAFKHGRRRVPIPGIEIYLKVDQSELTFRVVNHLREGNDEVREGIGLRNTRRRLELLYPDCHMLDIVKTDSRFKINLTISCKPQTR